MVGAIQTYRLLVNGLRYPFLVHKVNSYTQKFSEWNSTVTALKETDRDFRKIFSFKSKDKVLDTIDTSYSGDIDIENLMGEIQKTVERVDEIKIICVSRKISIWPLPKDIRWKAISALPMGGETILSAGNGPSIPGWIYQLPLGHPFESPLMG
jgi:hypothetical protein